MDRNEIKLLEIKFPWSRTKSTHPRIKNPGPAFVSHVEFYVIYQKLNLEIWARWMQNNEKGRARQPESENFSIH